MPLFCSLVRALINDVLRLAASFKSNSRTSMSLPRLYGKYFIPTAAATAATSWAMFNSYVQGSGAHTYVASSQHETETVPCGKACNVRWPCKGYDADFTTSQCPVMWTPRGEENKLLRFINTRDQHPTTPADGKTCEAPPSYVGPCDPSQRIRRPGTLRHT